MTRMQTQPLSQLPDPPSGAGLSPTDLAELMTAFTEVTTKLEGTHAQLRAEVARLSAELRDANEALQRSKRLAALGEMAAGISHEIRNPLGSIRLYANMLHDDLAQMPEQQQIVGKIGRAVRGLDEIVGDVLTFSRELKAQWHPCDASALVDAALEMCCAEITGSVVREDRGQNAHLMCDPALIQQALVNIMRNSAEANRVGGGERITVSVRSCQLDDNDRPVEAVGISISDQGDGIPQRVIERMFNPFFTTRATGTGLGLAIVHRIVDAHRGSIEVANHHRGRGARVEIVLPVHQTVVVSRAGHALGSDADHKNNQSQPGVLAIAKG